MFRNAIRTALRKTGFDIVRYQELVVHPFDVLSPVVRDRASRDPVFNFVQIGANDGLRCDPIRHLVGELRLPGLLVEPMPNLFEALQQNYAGSPGLAFENSAVAWEDGERVMYRIRPDADVPDWAHGLGSFDRAHLMNERHPFTEKDVEQVSVQVVSFRTLLTKHHITRIGLLQIDTEGYDAEIVRMVLSSDIRPELINYENFHVPLADRVRCKQMLQNHGYGFVDVGKDTLAAKLA